MSNITPRSSAQRDAWDGRRSPAPEEVAPDVWALAAPIPEGSLPHTLTYALLDPSGAVHLVDPGWGDEANLASLRVSLTAIGRSTADIATVIATHFHPDHLGLCDRLRAEAGARVVLSRIDRRVLSQETASERRDRSRYAAVLDEWGVPEREREELAASFDRPAFIDDRDADTLVDGGDTIELPGHRLRVVATPGHTDGHVCLVDDDRRILYSGDHVLPRINPGLGIGTLVGADPLGDYLDSLARLRPFDAFTVLPGHEFAFTGLSLRRHQLRDHHLRRTREVAALVPRLGDAPVWEYARRLTWTGGWGNLRGFLRHSALRQTALHRQFVASGRAERFLGG